MKVITTKMKVLRYMSRFDFSGRQDLMRETYFFGIRVWSRVVDTEDIPSWASIARATLGGSDWVSKFAYYIDADKGE